MPVVVHAYYFLIVLRWFLIPGPGKPQQKKPKVYLSFDVNA